MTPERPLSALLSQVLVAFTVEFDNEFERRMGEAGYPGARLSLVVWANLLRFVGESGIAVRDLTAQALAQDSQIKLQLGCLERWGVVVLGPMKREGWGSGRGIRGDTVVRLTSKGLTAIATWPPLCDEIELRWEKRFGKKKIDTLRRALQEAVDKLDMELPHGLAGSIDKMRAYPPRVTHPSRPALPTLLSQLLLAFRIEFDRESLAPLVLCANTLRVLSEEPIRASEIPKRTGGSPETSDIGWPMKPYVIVERDPAAKRGTTVRLSPRGIFVQNEYFRLVSEIEKRWKSGRIREALEQLFEGESLAEGLVPPKGTTRAGDQTPALGRKDIGPAARQRMRDLVAQTEAFVKDPAGALPHYPAWDMNRGFGP